MPLEPAPGTKGALDAVRQVSAHLDLDRPLSADIEAIAELIASGVFAGAVDAVTGPLP
jgi:histidine ammonia-lyase